MTALIKYDAACRALAECKAVDEVKAWADKAAAMQAYGKMAKDKTLEVDAAEIRIRAERRLGEMLTQQKADGGPNRGAVVAGNKPGEGQGSPVVVDDDRRPKLSDAGISKDLSSRAQKLAAVPEEEFESEVGEWRERVTAEGARVSARLQKAGERALKEQHAAPLDEADESPTLAELVDELQAENTRLTAEIKALTETDDQKAETIKWHRMYEHAMRQQADAMRSAASHQKDAKRLANQVRECCRALGLNDPRQLVPTVKKLAARQEAA